MVPKCESKTCPIGILRLRPIEKKASLACLLKNHLRMKFVMCCILRKNQA